MKRKRAKRTNPEPARVLVTLGNPRPKKRAKRAAPRRNPDHPYRGGTVIRLRRGRFGWAASLVGTGGGELPISLPRTAETGSEAEALRAAKRFVDGVRFKENGATAARSKGKRPMATKKRRTKKRKKSNPGTAKANPPRRSRRRAATKRRSAFAHARRHNPSRKCRSFKRRRNPTDSALTLAFAAGAALLAGAVAIAVPQIVFPGKTWSGYAGVAGGLLAGFLVARKKPAIGAAIAAGSVAGPLSMVIAGKAMSVAMGQGGFFESPKVAGIRSVYALPPGQNDGMGAVYSDIGAIPGYPGTDSVYG